MAQTILIVILLGLLGWFAFGTPVMTVENTLWPSAPAPWENVIGYYYPNKTDHTAGVMTQNSGTIAQCRDWADVTIASSNDGNAEHSEYWCGIGCSSMTDVKSCRTSTK